MSCCCHLITVSEGLELINSLIEGTEIENKVKEWKIKHTYVENTEKIEGIIGSGYWMRFRQWNDY